MRRPIGGSLDRSRIGVDRRAILKHFAGAVALTGAFACRAGAEDAALDALMGGVASGALGQSSSRSHAQINEQWQSQVFPLCRSALENRYPIIRGSQVDVTLDDFAKLFAPNGLIDSFFKTNLKSFVDTTRIPWHWQMNDYWQYYLNPAGPQSPAQLLETWRRRLADAARNGGLVTITVHPFVSGVDDDKFSAFSTLLSEAVLDPNLVVVNAIVLDARARSAVAASSN